MSIATPEPQQLLRLDSSQHARHVRVYRHLWN